MTHRQWHDLKQQCPHSSERQRVYKHVSLAIEVGDQVRELRTHLGLKQQELAELVGTSQSMIARLENGGQHPSLQAWERIAEALHADRSLRALRSPSTLTREWLEEEAR